MKHRKAIAALPKNPTIVQLLAYYVDRSGLMQRDIGQAYGLPANMVSMIKTGDARLPLERLPMFASTIGVDVFVLYEAWMRAYYPETWESLKSHWAPSRD